MWTLILWTEILALVSYTGPGLLPWLWTLILALASYPDSGFLFWLWTLSLILDSYPGPGHWHWMLVLTLGSYPGSGLLHWLWPLNSPGSGLLSWLRPPITKAFGWDCAGPLQLLMRSVSVLPANLLDLGYLRTSPSAASPSGQIVV